MRREKPSRCSVRRGGNAGSRSDARWRRDNHEKGEVVVGGGSVSATADDGNRAHALMGITADIVRQTQRRQILALTVAGATLQLQIQLVDHPQSRGAHRVPKTFEAAIDLA